MKIIRILALLALLIGSSYSYSDSEMSPPVKSIRVKFAYFWKDFSPDVFIEKNLPSDNYQYEIVDENPDIVFFSVFHKPQNPFLKFLHQVELQYKKKFCDQGQFLMPKIEEDCLKVFISYENCRIDMKQCDYAISLDYEEDIQHPNYHRDPHFLITYLPEFRKHQNESAPQLDKPERFCNFIYSNDNAPIRKKFFKKLSKYRRVDAPGKSMTNMDPIDRTIESKLNFIKNYKFTIAFENTSHPGYTSEKLTDAMAANSIPIYWGNPKVDREFNTKSFISYHDIEREVSKNIPSYFFRIPLIKNLAAWMLEEITLDRLVEQVIEIDTHDDLYHEMLQESWITEESSLNSLDPQGIKHIYHKIIRSHFA